MGHNRLKIISNQNIRTLSYFLLNENKEWVRASNSSVLSRKEYIEASIKEKAFDIIRVIDHVYNTGNRGVDIFFEGTEDEYSIICKVIEYNFSNDNISCQRKKTKIAIAGKIGSGKSTLIDGIGSFIGTTYTKQKKTGYDAFFDKRENTELFELKGIDLGKEYITYAKGILNELAENGLTSFFYCLSTYKIEQLEEELILNLRKEYPGIKILVVLTSCVDDESTLFAEQISKQLGQVKVLPVLAKEMKTRQGTINAFGVDSVVQYIYEGK